MHEPRAVVAPRDLEADRDVFAGDEPARPVVGLAITGLTIADVVTGVASRREGETTGVVSAGGVPPSAGAGPASRRP